MNLKSINLILKSHLIWTTWLVFIFIAVGLPGDSIPIVLNFWEWLQPDKIVHFIMFGGLSFLMLTCFELNTIKPISQPKKWSIILFAIIISGLTEYLQNTVFIGRDGNLFDFYADVLGVFIGYFMFLFYRKNWIN